ncbi:MAG: hypothetical protein IJI98_11090 [Methanosphaera sp.]|nr:hypothetical protein [Methanobrevibacter sp.]MBQ6631582.1 hypothetical protein [Romboutsia sp.]MBQ6754217.1 hypothetical protein [Bacteroidales bacterium]MBR0351339.1 hypothetical protein [Clostridia bacterium]MBR0473224.1 hypothetical protein [Methanosphaera sp.]
MLDFIFDYFEVILVIVMIILLIIATNYQFKEQIKCEQDGGVAIERFMSYQCLTKEDLEKLRGGK